MYRKNKIKNSKLKYFIVYLFVLIIALFCSSLISELLNISERQALFLVFVFAIIFPIILFVSYLLTFFLWLVADELGKKLKNSFANKVIDYGLTIYAPHGYKLLKISHLLFSEKIQIEVFQVIVGDWDEEIYMALKRKEKKRLFLIHLRNTYAFILAMWQKSPIGDLIEFVSKLAK